jgi:hypothetical protein
MSYNMASSHNIATTDLHSHIALTLKGHIPLLDAFGASKVSALIKDTKPIKVLIEEMVY